MPAIKTRVLSLAGASALALGSLGCGSGGVDAPAQASQAEAPLDASPLAASEPSPEADTPLAPPAAGPLGGGAAAPVEYVASDRYAPGAKSPAPPAPEFDFDAIETVADQRAAVGDRYAR